MPDVREVQSVVEDAERAARAGDYAAADRRLRDALALQEAVLGSHHPDLARTLNNLAVVCESRGQLDDAERFYRRGYAIASGLLPPADPLVVTSRDNLQTFCAAHGRPFDDWPGLGEFDAAPPAAPTQSALATRVATSRGTSGTVAPAAAPDGPATANRWVARVVAALLLAGAGVFATSAWWQTPSSRAPTLAAAPPALATAAPDAALAHTSRADAPATTPPETPRPLTPPDGIRIVTADVCASLSTDGNWRCTPIGAATPPVRASFYTRIASSRGLRVEHRWYRDTALHQRVELAVGANVSAGYRTFSRQSLSPGAWRVELRTLDGALLHEAAFDVR